MGKVHKINPDRAKNARNKCSFLLKTLDIYLKEQLYDCFKQAKNIEELDDKVEKILEEYYTCGNDIMDYYGIECGTIE